MEDQNKQSVLSLPGRFDLNMDDFFEGVLRQAKPLMPVPLSHYDAMFAARTINEELSELLAAVPQASPTAAPLDVIAAQADALGDMIVFLVQTFRRMGLDAQSILAAIHRANLAKAGGHYDAGGKWQKPVGWTPPDISQAILEQYTPANPQTGVSAISVSGGNRLMFVNRTLLPEGAITGAEIGVTVKKYVDEDGVAHNVPGHPVYKVNIDGAVHDTEWFGMLDITAVEELDDLYLDGAYDDPTEDE